MHELRNGHVQGGSYSHQGQHGRVVVAPLYSSDVTSVHFSEQGELFLRDPLGQTHFTDRTAKGDQDTVLTAS